MLCLRHLVAKFAINTSGALWPNMQLMQMRKWRHMEITPSHRVSFWVGCASGNVLLYSFSLYLCTLQLQSKTELTGDRTKCRYFFKNKFSLLWSTHKSKSLVCCQDPTKKLHFGLSFFLADQLCDYSGDLIVYKTTYNFTWTIHPHLTWWLS